MEQFGSLEYQLKGVQMRFEYLASSLEGHLVRYNSLAYPFKGVWMRFGYLTCPIKGTWTRFGRWVMADERHDDEVWFLGNPLKRVDWASLPVMSNPNGVWMASWWLPSLESYWICF